MELFQLGVEFGARYGCADIEDFWFGRKAITKNISTLKSSYDKKIQAAYCRSKKK